MTAGGTAEAEVTITHPTGLHARPAVKFTKLAKTFAGADIRIRGGEGLPWVDAKSIVKVMALKLRTGTLVQLEAEGEDACSAILALKALIERDFDERNADEDAPV
ncbi:MAG: HPr family phosphocarrier protein [Geminicoccaceae bacterium]